MYVRVGRQRDGLALEHATVVAELRAVGTEYPYLRAREVIDRRCRLRLHRRLRGGEPEEALALVTVEREHLDASVRRGAQHDRLGPR